MIVSAGVGQCNELSESGYCRQSIDEYTAPGLPFRQAQRVRFLQALGQHEWFAECRTGRNCSISSIDRLNSGRIESPASEICSTNREHLCNTLRDRRRSRMRSVPVLCAARSPNASPADDRKLSSPAVQPARSSTAFTVADPELSRGVSCSVDGKARN